MMDYTAIDFQVIVHIRAISVLYVIFGTRFKCQHDGLSFRECGSAMWQSIMCDYTSTVGEDLKGRRFQI